MKFPKVKLRFAEHILAMTQHCKHNLSIAGGVKKVSEKLPEIQMVSLDSVESASTAPSSIAVAWYPEMSAAISQYPTQFLLCPH